MSRLYAACDFEAEIRILRTDEGGRRTAPFNGIRWDFAYADDLPASVLYMIWPDFFDADGNSLPTDAPLPIDTRLNARMVILIPEMRASHRLRLKPGLRFYCHEGPRQVAEGTVTRLTGLFDDRSGPIQKPRLTST